MSEVAHKLAKNTVIQVAGKALGTVLSLATFAILVNHLEVEGFGALTIALNFAAMLGVLVDFGITLTATTMISEPDADEEQLLGNFLTLRILSAFVFLAIGAGLVFFFPYTLEVKIAAAVACASFFFGSVASMFIGVFQKRLTLASAVLAENLNRLVVVLAAFGISLMTPSVIAAAGIFVAGGVVQLCITLTAVGRYLHVRPQVSFALWKEIIRRSWPIGVSIAFNLVYLKGDIFFMSLYDVSDRAIGLYGAAYKVVDVVTTVPVMFMGLLLPLLTFTWAKGDRTGFGEHLQRGFDAFALLALPFAFGSIATGGALLALVHADLRDAGPILAVLGPATAVVFFGSLFGHAVVAIHRQRTMIVGYLAVAVLATVGYVLFIPNGGILAAAWVTLFSETLIMLITAVAVRTVSGVRIRSATLLRALGASLVMFGVLRTLPWPHVLVAILAGGAVYFLALWAFGGPGPKTLLRLMLPTRV